MLLRSFGSYPCSDDSVEIEDEKRTRKTGKAFHPRKGKAIRRFKILCIVKVNAYSIYLIGPQ